jgi:hypothetical protein
MLSSLKIGDISEGHARTLLMLKDRPEEQDVVYREILLKKLSVREVERITRKIAADKVRKKNWAGSDANLIAIEREFTDTLGTRVQILKTDYGGKLTIDYFSDVDLLKLLVMVKTQGKITDFHTASESGEEPTTSEEAAAAIIRSIEAATPLESVPDTAQVLAEAIESEQAVSEVIEETVAREAQNAADTAEEDELYSIRNFNL